MEAHTRTLSVSECGAVRRTCGWNSSKDRKNGAQKCGKKYWLRISKHEWQTSNYRSKACRQQPVGDTQNHARPNLGILWCTVVHRCYRPSLHNRTTMQNAGTEGSRVSSTGPHVLCLQLLYNPKVFQNEEASKVVLVLGTTLRTY